ncbi:hypothetical protein BH09MYX1_BH09MYX1_07810 [soil metagenome]
MSEPRAIENSLVHAKCPLCGAADFTELGALVEPRITRFSSVAVRLTEEPALARCSACQSCFIQRSIDGPTAAALYAEGDAGARWSSNRTWDHMHSATIVASLEKLIASGTTVLDVGCNTGELLDFARARGAKTSGIEYSSESRRRVVAKGHAAFADLAEAEGRFDVITAFDLVEHLYDVPSFLETARSLLSEKGRLVLLTGDIDCPSAKRDGARWWYVQPPEHVVFPSRAYFRSYLPALSVESVESTHSGTTPSFATRAFARLRGKPAVTLDHVLVTLRAR